MSLTYLLNSSSLICTPEMLGMMSNMNSIADELYAIFSECSSTPTWLEVNRMWIWRWVTRIHVESMIIDSVKRKYYLVMTGRYTDFQKVMATSIDAPNVAKYLDASMVKICYEILCFYLEAAIYLEQWPDVEAFIRTTSTIDSDRVRSIMVDMILTAKKMPLECTIRSLQVSLPHFPTEKNC